MLYSYVFPAIFFNLLLHQLLKKKKGKKKKGRELPQAERLLG